MEQKNSINNDFYQLLGEKWYTASDHPVALLRAENRLRIPWVIREMEKYFGKRPISLLDIGCGAGFLTNAVAKCAHQVTGIDLSSDSLRVAAAFDETKSVRYVEANGYQLPFDNHSFDVVTAMDLLEHVEDPRRLIEEASRLLKPGGLFFFHTFNRTPLSYLVVIKGVEWFVANTPQNMHIYPLFLKPKELQEFCLQNKMQVIQLRGFRPKVLSRYFWKMLCTRKVPEEFSFVFSKNKMTGYCGVAEKR